MIESILLGGGVFTAFLLGHALIFHYRPLYHRWKTVVWVFWIFLLVYAIFFWTLPFPNWLDILNRESAWAKWIAFLAGAGLYIFLFLSYAQFYFLVDRGISARILVEILRSDMKALSRDELRARYSPEVMQNRRLDDMLYGRYVSLENGMYRLTSKGKLNARIFDFCKRYLNLNPGG